MTRTTAVMLSATLVTLSVAMRARAEGATFDVPPACGSESALGSELARLAGADAERARPTFFRIAWDPSVEQYRLTLDVGGRRRELLHADCRVLFRSAVVIAAASVKATVETAPVPSVAPAEPTRPPPAALQGEPHVPTETSGSRARGSLAAGVGLGLGVLPGVAGGFELRAAVGVQRIGFELGARYFPARPVAVQGRDAKILALGFRAAGFYEPAPWLALSLGLDADFLSGSGGEGVATPLTDSAWTLAPSLELAGIPFKTKHLAIELAAEARVALVRPVFEVTGFRDLYRVPSLGMLLVARGVWLFP